MEIKRLFDCIGHQLQHFPKQDMLAAKENGQWKTYSTQEVKNIVDEFSAGLIELGIGGNDYSDEGTDKIGIISNNRPEWIFTDLAVQQTGAVLVPLYPTTGINEIQFILNDALVKYMFVSSKELYDKINSIKPNVPSLQKIYSFDDIEGVEKWTAISALATDASRARLEELKQTISPENLTTIIYTSGTTGTPKGVMLTHKNIYTNAIFSKQSFPFIDAPQYKVLSFLPLNHIFEKCVSYIYLFSGNGIYYAESLDTIGANLKEIKPDGFTTVPRLLEKVFERIMTTGRQLTGIKKQLFFWSVNLAEQYATPAADSPFYKFKLAIANKLVLSKWREALGGNIKFIITGGAACQVKLLRIFNAAKIPVYEGYGPTENSPVIAVNRWSSPADSLIGTVGPAIEGIEVKLAEDGEICVKGPTVMKGYYKRPDLTADTVIDGWLHTGDIGTWVDNKFLKITDRKKEIFKTSGGKYVAPQALENVFKGSPFIEQIMVIGEGKKFVSALIVPAFAYLKTWMELHNIPFTSNADTVKNAEVLKKYETVVEELNQQFNHVEQIKKFELLPAEWSLETGEMTPKMSLKRKVVLEKFKKVIDGIYG
ncbi:AMP-dependent synthetase/ligase [Parafilimonas sp.]|uniref:AMP-dependent synthetase/ligase n=1 Tax=Parafilimonas sp. TaxID=1969739 RepID=UPI003F7F50AC